MRADSSPNFNYRQTNLIVIDSFHDQIQLSVLVEIISSVSFVSLARSGRKCRFVVQIAISFPVANLVFKSWRIMKTATEHFSSKLYSPNICLIVIELCQFQAKPCNVLFLYSQNVDTSCINFQIHQDILCYAINYLCYGSVQLTDLNILLDLYETINGVGEYN